MAYRKEGAAFLPDLKKSGYPAAIMMKIFKIGPNETQRISELQHITDRVDVFVADPNNTTYKTINGLVYSKDLSRLYAVPCCLQGELVLPKETTDIWAGAFKQSSLTAVFGNNVISIGAYTFKNSEVTLFQFPNIQEIGFNAYIDSKIEHIDLGQKLQYILTTAFKNTNLQYIEIPASTLGIQNSAFADCKSLQKVVIHDRAAFPVIQFSERVFANCTSLISFAAPKGTVALSNEMFLNCCNLEHVILPNVEYIPNNIFKGCTSLQTLSLGCQCDVPEEIKKMGVEIEYRV